MLKWKIIYGCEGRGDGDSPYLTRWTLRSKEGGSADYVHYFHRSDHDEAHDHPWPFWTLVLWRGYREHIRLPDGTERVRRLWPGMIVYRPANHAHWVELIDGKPAVTFVHRGPYCREWGFFTAQGWQQWREYFLERGC